MVEMSETLHTELHIFFIDFKLVHFKLVHRRPLILSDALRCVHLSQMCWLY